MMVEATSYQQPMMSSNRQSSNASHSRRGSGSLQTCIRYASRLIKIRSQIRSPWSSSSAHATQKMSLSKSLDRLRNHSVDRSDIQRVQPLSLVTPIPNKKEIFTWQDEEDEEEDEDDDTASQLTYLSDLVREKVRRHAFQTRSQLAFPSRQAILEQDMIRPKRPSAAKPSITFTSFTSASQLLLTQGGHPAVTRRILSLPLLSSIGTKEDGDDQSSISTLDDEDDVLPSVSNRQSQQRSETAYLISLPPCAAAAASVARNRRWRSRQYHARYLRS